MLSQSSQAIGTWLIHVNLNQLADWQDRHLLFHKVALGIAEHAKPRRWVDFARRSIEHAVEARIAKCTIVVAVAGSADVEECGWITVVAVPATPRDHELALHKVFAEEFRVDAAWLHRHAERLLPLGPQFQAHPLVAR